MDKWNGFALLLSGAAQADTTLYKWLLGGGIVLVALVGLVFFGMLALYVLQQPEKKAPEGEETPMAEEAPAEAEVPADDEAAVEAAEPEAPASEDAAQDDRQQEEQA